MADDVVKIKLDRDNAGPDWLSPKEYANKHGVCVRTVWRWIERGTVKAKKINGLRGRWFIAR